MISLVDNLQSMPEFVGSVFIAEGQLSLYIDSELIEPEQETMLYKRDLENETHYILHWFVKGAPGTPYYITISAPREAEFQLMRGISSMGKDFGAIRFTT